MKQNKVLKNILEQYRKEDLEFDVYIVADAQKKTIQNSDTRICHADDSEFFSRNEFAQIASAIFNVFGFVKVFYSEVSFIKYFLDNHIDAQNCIVYNFARDGQEAGKKSLIPAFCDLYHIRYTGSDAFVISLLRNKALFSDILSVHNIATPISAVISTSNPEDIQQCKELVGREIIVKNLCESASIGLTHNCQMLLSEDTYEQFRQTVKGFNHKQVFVQEYIAGTECEVLVLQYQGIYYAMDPIVIEFPTGVEFMDSQLSNSYNYEFKILDSPIAPQICAVAERAASILGVRDYARFDFRLKNGTPYLFDIAGTPYTVHHSSIAYLFKEYQLCYEDIYKAIVTCMLSNYRYDTEIGGY